MKKYYSINVQKEYLNFAASHFLTFKNGHREPLHGHNYYVRVQGKCEQLSHDMVFDFLKIKPLVKKICDFLDHKLLLPEGNPLFNYQTNGNNLEVRLNCGTFFSFPKEDTLILPINNISAELLAQYLAEQISKKMLEQFKFKFQQIEVEVEESKGQSAIFTMQEE